MDKPQECYVAFLDILGFRDFVEAKKPEYVQKYLSCLRDASKAFNLSQLSYAIKIFSDSIIISVPVEQSGEYLKDTKFLLYINTFLLHNIIDDSLGELPLRGAITKGNFFTDESEIIFGKALIEAHYFESKKAQNPRVLVMTGEFCPEKAKEGAGRLDKALQPSDSDFYKKLKNLLNESKEQSELRCRDTDGHLFCNYLSALRKLDGGWVPHYKSAVGSHRNFILKKLTEVHSDGTRDKYNWMKKYHNWFCSGYTELNNFTIQ